MKVILLRDVESLGSAGEVVQVKSGFARNFLIPQRQALVASDTNVAQFESKRKQHAAVSERERRAAEAIAKQLEADSITAQVRVGEEDRLFGSVTVQNIADLLAEKDYDIDRRAIQLEEPIRALGVYTIDVRLHADVTANVKLWVVKE
ncbi:MAG: 50S ribosomal protein L9 [Candidatus Latescibacterota bacterium]|nr:50S ribosomal protein L9 [Candidatus Latescibacterota bacterium]MEC8646369.1 50S ribosomal protein L9 [Candidatus Latescibacterota bacterium]MEE2628211.1 50S ribosomal protein L9 [Candidatus Latescibacterota bacterium]MEE2728255.1 50S ribosomal protein L9 [Candidatus Latescibacterota bacterium]